MVKTRSNESHSGRLHVADGDGDARETITRRRRRPSTTRPGVVLLEKKNPRTETYCTTTTIVYISNTSIVQRCTAKFVVSMDLCLDSGSFSTMWCTLIIANSFVRWCDVVHLHRKTWQSPYVQDIQPNVDHKSQLLIASVIFTSPAQGWQLTVKSLAERIAGPRCSIFYQLSYSSLACSMQLYSVCDDARWKNLP